MVNYTVHNKYKDWFDVTIGTKRSGVMRSLMSSHFHAMFNIGTKTLLGDDLDYFALGTMSYPHLPAGYTVVMASNGPAHGDTDEQRLITMENPEDVNSEVENVVLKNGSGTFQPAALGTIATIMLAAGITKLIIKRYLFTLVGSSVGDPVTLPTITFNSGDGDRIYTPWSVPVLLSDNNLYRTCYQTNTNDSRVLFAKSTDGGSTWTGVSIIASDASLRFGETDIVEIDTNVLLAIIREDSTDGRPFYWAISTDLGVTWTRNSAPFNEDLVGGTQPSLRTLAANSFLLMAGDRTGNSGSSQIGQPRISGNYTGIIAHKITRVAITTATRSGSIVTLTLATSISAPVGSQVVVQSVNPSGYNVMAVARDGSSGTTLIYDAGSDPGAYVSGGYVLAFGWRTPFATYIGTDGGQPMPAVLADGTAGAWCYGVRRYSTGYNRILKPDVFYVRFDPDHL